MAKAVKLSTSGQIEYCSKIGKLVEENPELNYEFIKQILISQQEVKADKLEKYDFAFGAYDNFYRNLKR